MTNPTSSQAWATYLDFDEAWQYLQMDNAPEGGDALRLQRFIDSACTTAQNAVGRPLCPTQFHERFDGWGGEYLQLRYSPFIKLVLCTEWQSLGASITLTESTPANPTEGIQIDYATSRVMRSFMGGNWPRPFFPGSRNIEVTYIAGFDPVPADVWEATMELVAWRWRNTQEAVRNSPIGPSMGYDGQASNSGLWPGVPFRIAEVFSLYRLPSIG